MAEYTEKSVAIESAWMILEGIGFDRARNSDLERTVLAVFESAPAADVVERKTARWEYNPGGNVPYCSNCMMPQEYETNYCHDCGARMEGPVHG